MEIAMKKQLLAVVLFLSAVHAQAQENRENIVGQVHVLTSAILNTPQTRKQKEVIEKLQEVKALVQHADIKKSVIRQAITASTTQAKMILKTLNESSSAYEDLNKKIRALENTKPELS